MALHHASAGEVVHLGPLGSDLQSAPTRALVKTDSFEAIRLVLKAGEVLPAHKVSGQLTLHCIEGRVEIDLANKSVELSSHQWIYFDSGAEHGLRALEDSSLLLTILFPANGADKT